MNTPDDILQLLKKYNQTVEGEIAGFAMAFSPVSVVANSLMLRRYVPTMERGITKEAESGSKV